MISSGLWGRFGGKREKNRKHGASRKTCKREVKSLKQSLTKGGDEVRTSPVLCSGTSLWPQIVRAQPVRGVGGGRRVALGRMWNSREAQGEVEEGHHGVKNGDPLLPQRINSLWAWPSPSGRPTDPGRLRGTQGHNGSSLTCNKSDPSPQ